MYVHSQNFAKMSLFTTEMTKSLAEKIDAYHDELFPSSRTSKFARSLSLSFGFCIFRHYFR